MRVSDAIRVVIAGLVLSANRPGVRVHARARSTVGGRVDDKLGP